MPVEISPPFHAQLDAGPRVSGRALPLHVLTYTVVDVETTGLSAYRDGITEICCLRVAGDRVVDRFSTLVNPGQPIPHFIQGMTGITDAMVRDAPFFRQVIPAFLEFLGESVLVAHNAPFDLSFINYGLYSNGHPHLHNPAVDTIRLAKRLLPDLPRRSLDAVTQYLGIFVADRHRAYGDASATAEVLLRLLPLARQRGVESDVQLMAFLGFGQTEKRIQAVTPKSPRASRAAKMAVLSERCRSLPDAPGVYIMRSSSGAVLYVGKAISLRKRVASYFSGGASGKVKRLMGQVESIEHQQAASELEALLEESRLIKHYQPPFNVLLRSYRDYPFIRVTTDGGGTYGDYPHLDTTRRVSDDDSLYFGPFRGRRSTELVVEILRKCFRLLDDRCPNHGSIGESCIYYQMRRCVAPCLGRGHQAAYAEAVAEVCRLLESSPEDLVGDLVRRRDEASERLDYETAAVYRDAIDALGVALSHRRLLTPAIDGLNVLAVCPSLHPGWVELFVFGDGRLVSRTRLNSGDGDADRREVADLLQAVVERRLAAGSRPAVRIDAQSLDQVNIISGWLERHGPTASTITLEPGWLQDSFAQVVDRVVEAARVVAGREDPS